MFWEMGVQLLTANACDLGWAGCWFMKFQQWPFGLFLSRDWICRVYKKCRMARIVAWGSVSLGSHCRMKNWIARLAWRFVSHSSLCWMKNCITHEKFLSHTSHCRVRNFIALSREKFYRVVAWGMLSHCRVRNYSHCCVRNFITLLVLSPEKFLLHS